MFKDKSIDMRKIDRSLCHNPPAPPGMDNEGLIMTRYYKPETNPIVKMLSEERAALSGNQSVVHLLDQFFLHTPPSSEDEEESVKEPIEVVRLGKPRIEPAAAKCKELDDSIITKSLFEFVAEENPAAGKKSYPISDAPKLLPALMEIRDRPLPEPAYDHPGSGWKNTSAIPELKREKKDDGEIEKI